MGPSFGYTCTLYLLAEHFIIREDVLKMSCYYFLQSAFSHDVVKRVSGGSDVEAINQWPWQVHYINAPFATRDLRVLQRILIDCHYYI